MKYPTSTVQCIYKSPLGDIRLAANEDKLIGLWFVGQKHEVDASNWSFDQENPVFIRIKANLENYFAGKTMGIDEFNWMHEIVFPKATEFEQLVWQQLLSIHTGHTVSYSDLATQIGKPKAYRAVAAAVGKNPISLIVPCHRVVGKNGALTGYAGGLDRKKALLLIEQKAKI